MIGPLNGSPNRLFVRSFPVGQEVLDISQIGITLYWIWPPSFIQTWLWQYCLKYFLWLVERLSQRCHLFRINEVLKCCDSMTDLHMLSQIPSSCVCFQPLVCATAPRILTNFSPSHVKSSFYTDKTEPIEKQDLYHDSAPIVPKSHPSLRTCDLPLSKHQCFLHEIELRQCVFCKEPLLFWFASRRRNFGLLGSEYKCCASLISLPLS